MSTHEDRLASLERRMGQVETKMSTLEQAVIANTGIALAIKEDTAEMVVLLKASKIFARFLAWAATIGGACTGIYAALKGFK